MSLGRGHSHPPPGRVPLKKKFANATERNLRKESPRSSATTFQSKIISRLAIAIGSRAKISSAKGRGTSDPASLPEKSISVLLLKELLISG
jgi:hypothetical protein